MDIKDMTATAQEKINQAKETLNEAGHTAAKHLGNAADTMKAKLDDADFAIKETFNETKERIEKL